MRIHLNAIEDTGLRLQYAFDPAGDEGLRAVEENGEAVFLTPVSVALEIHRVADTVEIRGNLSVRLRLTCGRCLTEFEQDVDTDFFCVFVPRPEKRRHPSPGDLELDADDVSLFFFDGQAIDTDEAVREEVLGAIPFRALCREDCRGLCPQCGTNLNTGSCTCATGRIDPRLAVLAGVKKGIGD